MMVKKEIIGNGRMLPDKVKKPRVLVLDTVMYQRLFDAMLGQDYELLSTDDPGEALLMASTQDPDLILLSPMAGKIDGVTIAKEMRETALSNAIILMMMTSDKPTIRREAKKAGCDGFLIKPLDPDKLKSQLDDWLKSGGR